MKIAIGVPVMYNFKGFTKLMRSIQGTEITFYVQDNWNENIGVAAAWNIFLDQAVNDNVDLLYICNDDVTFNPESFWRSVRAWENRPSDCILMAGTASPVEHEFMEGLGDFCCFALDPKLALDEIGYFDSDNFNPAYFEDNDYAYRISLTDWKQYRYGGLDVSHEGSATQFWNGKDDGVVSHQAFRANELRYIDKWGGLPGQETFLTPFDK